MSFDVHYGIDGPAFYCPRPAEPSEAQKAVWTALLATLPWGATIQTLPCREGDAVSEYDFDQSKETLPAWLRRIAEFSVNPESALLFAARQLELIERIATGSTTANSLPHIAKIARGETTAPTP